MQPHDKIGFHRGSHSRNNCISYLQDHARHYPQKTALIWTNKSEVLKWSGKLADKIPHSQINFGDFFEKVKRTAAGLRSLGIKKGDAVIIFLPMSVELYQAMFAVMQLGAISVFLDSWARRTHLGASADQVNPKAMISFDAAFQFCKEVPEIDQIPLKISSLTELEKSLPLEDLVAVETEETALITFTTGSSGKPKGANRTHQFLSAQHLALNETIPYEDRDIDLPAFPIFSLNNLACGVSTLIPAVDIGAPTARDPLILIGQMKSLAATCCTLSPSMLVEIARYAAQNSIELSELRRVVTGGAPISKDDLRAFKAVAPQTEIWILYGSTEVEPIAHIEAKEMLACPDGEGVNVGHFAEGLEWQFIQICKENIVWTKDSRWENWIVAKGQVGEIVVSGLHVCKNYYNYPEATAQTKIIDGEGKIWHRTGDLGYIDSENRVWIVGRVHNALSRNGKWYFPVTAEIILKRLPFAYRVAFFGVKDDELGERTVAAVSPKDKGLLKNPAPCEKQIREALEQAGIPVDLSLLVDEIPMDPRHHSKVEYGVLRDRLFPEAKREVRA